MPATTPHSRRFGTAQKSRPPAAASGGGAVSDLGGLGAGLPLGGPARHLADAGPPGPRARWAWATTAFRRSRRHIRYRFRTLDEVAPSVPLALVAAEDQRFLLHHGFDLDALTKAAKRNWNGDGKHIVGGSTISQQVAKNVFLWQGRSYVRKAAEAYFTVLIELLWSKRRIMEMYLSVAEMGDCTFGVEAASQRYFRQARQPGDAAEAALLAGRAAQPAALSGLEPRPGGAGQAAAGAAQHAPPGRHQLRGRDAEIGGLSALGNSIDGDAALHRRFEAGVIDAAFGLVLGRPALHPGAPPAPGGRRQLAAHQPDNGLLVEAKLLLDGLKRGSVFPSHFDDAVGVLVGEVRRGHKACYT